MALYRKSFLTLVCSTTLQICGQSKEYIDNHLGYGKKVLELLLLIFFISSFFLFFLLYLVTCVSILVLNLFTGDDTQSVKFTEHWSMVVVPYQNHLKNVKMQILGTCVRQNNTPPPVMSTF